MAISAKISISAETSLLERQVSEALNRISSRGTKLSLNNKNFGSPFSTAATNAEEFNKSLQKAESRVFAFGSAVGTVYQVANAFQFLVSSTIDVEKQLATINNVLGASATDLANFGNNLFSIAKNTGTTFQQAAAAATEFSRQGLGLNETLKRTRDSLILSRLSGLDVVQSTEAMTAAVNSFSSSALSTSDVVNKLANVDAKFAVSSADLAQAVQRVGSSAVDAGVSFDQLLGIVTSVQQTTARGGAVIGNALKTIFTKIQNPAIISQLADIGVAVKDAGGNARPAIEVLKELTNTFDTLSQSSRAQISQLIGGTYQINVLKAALSDLGKQYSVVDRATIEAGNSTDQATRRNEELNKTLSAQLNALAQNATNVASKIGQASFAPTTKGYLTYVNDFLTQASEKDSESAGAKIGSGVIKGISNFILGPGLAFAAGIVTNLLQKFGGFAKDSALSLVGVTTQAEQEKAVLQQINGLLAKSPELQKSILDGSRSRLSIESDILALLKQQTIEARTLANFSELTAKSLTQSGASNIAKSIPPTTSALGHIPKTSALGAIPEQTKLAEAAGAVAGGYRPGRVVPAPKEIGGVMNEAETVVYAPGLKQPFINPPKNSVAGQKHKDRSIKQLGIDPYSLPTSFGGFTPNFTITKVFRGYEKTYSNRTGLYGNRNIEDVDFTKKDLNQYTQKYPNLIFDQLQTGGNLPGLTYSTSTEKSIAENFASNKENVGVADLRILSEKGNIKLFNKFQKNNLSKNYNDYLIGLASKKPFGVERKTTAFNDEKEVRVLDPLEKVPFTSTFSGGFTPNLAEDQKIIAYHASKIATSPTFEPKFKTDLSSMGFHFGTEEQAKFRTTQYDFQSDSPSVRKYKLDIKNPLEVSHMASFAPDHLAEKMIDMGILDEDQFGKIRDNFIGDEPAVGSALVKILKKNGYDGLKYSNEREGKGYSHVPFDQKQIEQLNSSKGFVPNLVQKSTLFDTNILKNITQKQGSFGQKLDIRARNQAQLKASSELSQTIGVDQESILGDEYFQSEFRKFVPNLAATPNLAITPNFAGLNSNLLKAFRSTKKILQDGNVTVADSTSIKDIYKYSNVGGLYDSQIDEIVVDKNNLIGPYNTANLLAHEGTHRVLARLDRENLADTLVERIDKGVKSNDLGVDLPKGIRQKLVDASIKFDNTETTETKNDIPSYQRVAARPDLYGKGNILEELLADNTLATIKDRQTLAPYLGVPEEKAVQKLGKVSKLHRRLFDAAYIGISKNKKLGLNQYSLANQGFAPNFSPDIDPSDIRQILQTSKFKSIVYKKKSGEVGTYNAAQHKVRRDLLVGAPPPEGYSSYKEFDENTNSAVFYTQKEGEKQSKFRRLNFDGIIKINAAGQTYNVKKNKSGGFEPFYSKGRIPNFAGLGSPLLRAYRSTKKKLETGNYDILDDKGFTDNFGPTYSDSAAIYAPKEDRIALNTKFVDLNDRSEAVTSLTHEAGHRILDQFDKEREKSPTGFHIPLRTQLVAGSLNFDRLTPKEEKEKIPFYNAISQSGDQYATSQLLEEFVAEGELSNPNSKQILSPYINVSDKQVKKIGKLRSRLNESALLGSFGKFNKGFAPNFAPPSQKILQEKLTPEILSTFTGGSELFKYIKSLGVDPLEDKGKGRAFIPLSKNKGLKIAINPSGVSQNEVEFPLLNDLAVQKQYSSILPEGQGYDQNNFLYGFVERLKKPTADDFKRILGKPRHQFLGTPGNYDNKTGTFIQTSETEDKVREFLDQYGLSPDYTDGANLGLGKNQDKKEAFKLLDIGYNTGIARKHYFGQGLLGLGKPFSAQGSVPNFDSIQEAKKREMAAGYSPSQVKVGFDSRLKKSGGIGIYNSTEGSLQQAIGLHLSTGKSISDLQTQGAAKGSVPNFSDIGKVPNFAPDSFDLSAITGFVGILAFAGKDLIGNFKALGESTKETIKDQKETISTLAKELENFKATTSSNFKDAIDKALKGSSDQDIGERAANEKKRSDTQAKVQTLKSTLTTQNNDVNKEIGRTISEASVKKQSIQTNAQETVAKKQSEKSALLKKAQEQKSSIDTESEAAITAKTTATKRKYLKEIPDISKADLQLKDIRSARGSNSNEIKQLKQQLAESKDSEERKEIRSSIKTKKSENSTLFRADRARVAELKQDFLSQDDPFIQETRQKAQAKKTKIDTTTQEKVIKLDTDSDSVTAAAKSKIAGIDTAVKQKLEQLKTAGQAGSIKLQAQIDELLKTQSQLDATLVSKQQERRDKLQQEIKTSESQRNEAISKKEIEIGNKTKTAQTTLQEAQQPFLKRKSTAEFVRQNGFLVGQGISAIGQVGAQFVKPENAKTKAALEGVAEVGNYAGSGAIFGPIGAGIGAVVGGLIAFNKVLDADAGKRLEELGKKLENFQDKAGKASDSIGNYIANTEALSDALSNPKASGQTINRIQKNLTDELSKIPDDYRSKIQAANGNLDVLRETFSQINEELKKNITRLQAAASIAQTISDTQSGAILRTIGIGTTVFDKTPKGTRNLESVTSNLKSSIIIDKVRPENRTSLNDVGDDAKKLVESLKLIPGITDEVADSAGNLTSGVGDVRKVVANLIKYFDDLASSENTTKGVIAEQKRRIAVEQDYQKAVRDTSKDIEFLSAQFSSAFEVSKGKAATTSKLRDLNIGAPIRFEQERLRGAAQVAGPLLTDRTKANFDEEIKSLSDVFDKNNRVQDEFNNSQVGIVDIVSKKFQEASNKVTENSKNAGENFGKPAALAESSRDSKIRDAIVPIVNKAILGLKSGAPIDTTKLFQELETQLSSLSGKDFSSSLGELKGKIQELISNGANNIQIIQREFEIQQSISQIQADYQRKAIDLQQKLTTAGGPSEFLNAPGKAGLSQNFDKLTNILDSQISAKFTGKGNQGRADFQLSDFLLNNLNLRSFSKESQTTLKDYPGLADLQKSSIEGRAFDLKKQFQQAGTLYSLSTGKEFKQPSDKQIKDIAKTQISSQLKLENMPDDIAELRDSAQVLNTLIENQTNSIQDQTKQAFSSALKDAQLDKVDGDITKLAEVFIGLQNSQAQLKFEGENKTFSDKFEQAKIQVNTAEDNVKNSAPTGRETFDIAKRGQLDKEIKILDSEIYGLTQGGSGPDKLKPKIESRETKKIELDKLDKTITQSEQNKKDRPNFIQGLQKAKENLIDVEKTRPTLTQFDDTGKKVNIESKKYEQLTSSRINLEDFKKNTTEKLFPDIANAPQSEGKEDITLRSRIEERLKVVTKELNKTEAPKRDFSTLSPEFARKNTPAAPFNKDLNFEILAKSQKSSPTNFDLTPLQEDISGRTEFTNPIDDDAKNQLKKEAKELTDYLNSLTELEDAAVESSKAISGSINIPTLIKNKKPQVKKTNIGPVEDTGLSRSFFSEYNAKNKAGSFDLKSIEKERNNIESELDSAREAKSQLGKLGYAGSNDTIDNKVSEFTARRKAISQLEPIAKSRDNRKNLLGNIQDNSDNIKDLSSRPDKNNPVVQAQLIRALQERKRLSQEEADANLDTLTSYKSIAKNDISKYAEEYADSVRKVNEAAIRAGRYGDVSIGEQVKANYQYGKKETQRDQFSLIDTFSTDFKSGISSAFSEAIKGTKTLREAFLAVFENLGNKLTDKTLDIAVNGLFNAGTNLVTSKADGGLIQKFSRGGVVQGGSGNKDDVPAMMNGGEFVIRKSSVRKYGTEFLDRLNAGVVTKKADGGSFNQVLQNEFQYNDAARPTGGQYVVDSKLSALALTDENNPQNKVKEARVDKLNQYLSDYADYQAQKEASLKAYRAKVKQVFYQGLINAGTSVAGSALGSIGKGGGSGDSAPNKGYDYTPSGGNTAIAATGGLISSLPRVPVYRAGGFVPTYAGGGSNKDDVPALLMGGEYVLNKGAVKTYGSDFLNRLNRGQLPKFASGGIVGQGFSVDPVGKSVPANGNVSDSSDKIDDLVQALNDLIDELANKNTDKPTQSETGKLDSGVASTTATGGSQVVSNISITINDNAVSNSTSDGAASSDNNKNADQTQGAQQVSKLIEAKVIEVVSNQLRPGGLLYRTQDKSR